MTTGLVLVSIGNTRTRIAPVVGGDLEPSRGRVLANDDVQAIAQAIAAACAALDAETAESSVGEHSTALIASVNAPVCDQIVAALKSSGVRSLRFGTIEAGTNDSILPIPITHSLDDASTVGQDRLLDALGAFARSNQACVVIDAGTAVTIDFVDGEGTFHGGVIAPGMRMMLSALHHHTAALPLIEVTKDLLQAPNLTPESETPIAEPPQPFGKTTAEAIARGVAGAIRGLAHEAIDQYAEFYGAYPRVIATGGDAPLLFENDPLVEAIVPDLTLIGMLEAAKRLDQLATDE